jgi:hypothetical protein
MDYISNRVFDGTRPLAPETADALRAMHKKKPRPLRERLLEAAERWEPLPVGKLCREAAEALDKK